MKRFFLALAVMGGFTALLWWLLTTWSWHSIAWYAIGVVLPPVALLVCCLGMLLKIFKWTLAPVPFPIALTTGQQASFAWIKPSYLGAPTNTGTAILRIVCDALFFLPLLRNSTAQIDKHQRRLIFWPSWGLWIFALLFHYSLLIVCMHHFRFVFETPPTWLRWAIESDGWFELGTPRLWWSGFILCLSIMYLLLRRICNPVIRRVSLPTDYIPLFLLLAIVISGLSLRYIARTDVLAASVYVHNIPGLQGIGLSNLSPLFMLHIGLGCSLLLYFPFSKLTHGIGLFYTPTLNTQSDSRRTTQRHQKHVAASTCGFPVYQQQYAEELSHIKSSGNTPQQNGGSATP